ncbi:hypothetical protein KAI04_04750 [Candidatus Pacearchaeota archaeon]|nr:hypothetical protein [Candidatus Pacearchaeota archaeon]
MAIFKRRNKGILDLTEKYRKDQAKAVEMQAENSSVASPTSETSNAFGFLGNMASASTSSSETSEDYPTMRGDTGDRKRQLSKRLLDITEKLEDLSNQIYHLQQRIELLERKTGVGGY